MNGEVGMIGLLGRNLAAGLLIAVILLIRAAFSEKLSRRAILPLWGIAALRIVLPFSMKLLLPPRPRVIPKALVSAMPDGGKAGFDLFPTAYMIAAALVFGGFLLAHFRSRRVFRDAVPCTDRAVLQSVKGGSRRHIRVRVSDRIIAPLTCGLFRPTILLPKTLTETGEELELILAHELTHIRRGDLFYKLLLVGAVSLGWLNPFAWVMLILANRDLEFACDEAVLKKYPARRAEYARMLIRAEERKNNIFASAFSGSNIKKRVERIMKYKKGMTFVTAVAGAFTVASVSVFVSAGEMKNVQWYVNGEDGTKTVSEEEANAAVNSGDVYVYRLETDGEVPFAGKSGEAEAIATFVQESGEGFVPSGDGDGIEEDEKAASIYAAPVSDIASEPNYDGEYSFFPAKRNSEIHAIADGEVVYAEKGFNDGYGNTVVVKHQEDLYAIYGHLDSENGIAVQAGDRVQTGQTLGYAGNTGMTDRVGLGFRCVDAMPEFQRGDVIVYGNPLPGEESGENDSCEDYDYIRPTEGGYIKGRYN